MSIAAARWLPYRLPLVRPWASAAGSLETRSGALLRLEAADGRIGWGDAAPFPEIGIDEAAARRHAEECARLDLAAQAAGLALADWLAGAPAARSLAVNAALGDLAGLAPDAVEAALAAGFTVLKLKVGVAAPAEEIARLRALAARLPAAAALRLDANRAWDEAAAAAFLAACRGLPVESCEEPLAAPDPGALARLQAGLPFPLALDESLGAVVGDPFLAAPPVRRLVLKPARHGGLLATLAIARRARRAGLECVITSALESSCGLLAAAHLAAAAAPELTHGLATGAWFAADTGLPPLVADGRLTLPEEAGIGFHHGDPPAVLAPD